MKQWLTSILTGLSLVICVCTCVLWARSHWRSDALRFRKTIDSGQPVHARTVMIYSGAGAIELAAATDVHYLEPDKTLPDVWFYVAEDGPEHPTDTPIASGWRRSFAGFGLLNDNRSGPPMTNLPFLGQLFVPTGFAWTKTFSALWLPHWFLALIFSVLPAKEMLLWIRSRRRRTRGLCVKCGYDLRGGGEQCPECGEVRRPEREHVGAST
jgi:4-amino-4-deoxy-L-arabinose transferase-like glycosyltransferase